MEPEERLYTTAELAKLWSVSLDWVRRKFRARQGVIRLGTRHMRIPESVAGEFLREYGYRKKGGVLDAEPSTARQNLT